MPLNPEIRDQAYQFFIEEASELLQVIEQGLLNLHQDRSTSKVHELMRAAHSIKGGAASVELDAIELLAHRLEDFFKALYSDKVEFDRELESLLLEGYDCLSHPLNQQIEEGSFDESAALLAAEPIFTALEARLGDALQNSDSYIPSSNDLGVDIVASIFEIDVAQAIKHLKTVQADPSNYDLAAELQSQLDMLAGFAELFNLSGFSDIVETARLALTVNPQGVLEIIAAVAADCSIARERILAGDRQEGGEVSFRLQKLAQTKTLDASNNLQLDTIFEELEESNSLWSSLPEEEPLAEDIFGILSADSDEPDRSQADLTVEPTLEEANSLWSSLPEEEPLAEDIFGILSADSDEPDRSQADLTVEPTLEESNNLWSDLTQRESLVEKLFNGVSDNDSRIEEITRFLDIFSEESLTKDNSKLAPQAASQDLIAEEQPVETSNSLAESEITTTESESIEDFDALHPTELPAFFSSSAKTTSQSRLQKSKPRKAARKLFVKVDLERLEKMNNLVEELTINHNSLALQNQQLQENVSRLERKLLRFGEITQKVRNLSDLMLVEQRLDSLSNSKNIPRDNPSCSTTLSEAVPKEIHFDISFRATGEDSQDPLASSMLDEGNWERTEEKSQFDSLELDSYTTLNSALQEILEEIIQLEESVNDISIFARQSDTTISARRQMLDRTRRELMWVRMLPLEQILQRFPRTLRDMSDKYHKPVELKLTGTDALVDRAVLEKLSDPLLHLLRNAFDHGIEEPEVRKQQGKPAKGLIEIKAYYQGNQTVIEVRDDGRGLDLAKLARIGVKRGLISEQEASSATPQKLFDLIFEPGFSTAKKVNEISGRGVGMDIVRSQIATLKGKISVASTSGKGSLFTLRLPLTLSIAKLLICSLGATTFAIPSDSIEEIIVPTAEQIKLTPQQKFLSFDRQLIPIYPLKDLLQYNCPIPITDRCQTFKTVEPPPDWLAPLLLLRRGQQLFALEVVSLLNEQELVIKPYGKAIAAPGYSYGCTILGDGSLIPVFDGSAAIEMILSESEQAIPKTKTINKNLPQFAKVSLAGDRKVNRATTYQTIMIVDDSTTLRRTMALALERQGYRVIQRKDGKDALDGFKQNPDLDLIICDLEMPVMNGLEFLGMRRRDSTLSQVPTLILTSRGGLKHRSLAMQLGADGYLIKPYDELELVAKVTRILSLAPPVDSDSQPAVAIGLATILIIDDSAALRRTLAFSLKQKGYRVLQARDGAEGLETLRNNLQTKLVICDLEMPNTNGFEFLNMRRQQPDLAKIPVIMLTSRGSDKHQALAGSLGAEGFFIKPYVEEQFLQDIAKFIR